MSDCFVLFSNSSANIWIFAGFDLFETKSTGAEVDIGLPEKVKLIGNPTPLLSENLGLEKKTDTIVERKQEINPFEQGDSETVDIELMVLSLKSANSFDGSALGLPGMVDLYVVINKLDLPGLPSTNGQIEPSTGKMTIRHENGDGEASQGTFDSVFPKIEALLIFVASGGKLSNPADWLHSMQDPNPITLTGKGGWSHNRPQGDVHNEKYPAGKFYIVSPGKDPITEKPIPPIIHKGPHPVEVSPVIFDQPLTAILLSDNTVSLTWVTGMEEFMAGFVTYRGELKNEAGVCTDNVNDYVIITMISWTDSQVGNAGGGASYSITDTNGESNTCYGLVAVGFDGTFEIQTAKISE